MRGQTDVIAIILISGVIIALVGAAYLWGVPLINKQSTATAFEAASALVLDLNDQLIDTANAGGGEGSLSMPFGGMTVVPYDPLTGEGNYLLYEVTLSQPLALEGTEIYLGGATYADLGSGVGQFGEAAPSVITFTMEPLGTQYKGIFKIFFRTLEDKPNTYRIMLDTQPGSPLGQASVTGTATVSWRFDRIESSGPAFATHLVVTPV
ncbi:MAG: hypothetical protein HY520_03670 [Candidatus Aenigmarchaeota archaeon]|nr:hypothetical protein [Candidatus Aenigmarchaeota archaeon]